MSIAFFIGALIGSAVLTAILYAGAWSWPAGFAKSAFIHLIALIIAVLLSAIGAANGGPPDFSTAGYYLLSQAVLFACDLMRLWGKRRRHQFLG